MTPNPPTKISGQKVVLALLLLGLIFGFTLSRLIPRSNPKEADPGSPYYSPPTDDELKALREKSKTSGTN